MNTRNFFRKFVFALGRVLPGAALLLLSRNAEANPTGFTVQSGVATFNVNGSTFTVNAGNNAQLNWSSFNIAPGETTVFNQPSSASVVWNRINDQNPSQIYGSLQANGVVVLLNSSGFYFGPNSFVSAAGLVVSTANYTPPQNAGGAWVFNGPPPLASIVNYGQIKIGNGGDCFLIADKVENHGTVEAPGGNVGFAAGQTVTLSERPDGRGMSMQVTLPQGSVDNSGRIIADGGTIALNAQVVNQGGFIQANSVQNHNGVIELVASSSLNLDANSRMLANGDETAAGSAGGSVALKSAGTFSDAAGSRIETKGGVNGGNGGDVEVSAPDIRSLNTAMDASAQAGFVGGQFLLDPVNIILGTSGAGTVPAGGTVLSTDNGNGAVSGTLTLNVNTAFANKNFSNIKLQATGDITLNANTVWNLSGSTGVTAGSLVLQAGGSINFSAGSAITDANGWSIALAAGYNFGLNQSTPGTGSILFGGNSYLQTSAGGINLQAGKDITVGSGYVITKGGGSINAHALSGNIDTGSDAVGYVFKNATTIGAAYDLSAGLGGISTAAGGDVNLTAGGNITSVLPGNGKYYVNGNAVTARNNYYLTAGAGAYGPEAGNINLIAGGDVTGNYLVANGTGNIFAGVLMDANGNPISNGAGGYQLGTMGSAGNNAATPNLSLNVINGGWNVDAAQNIFLQEVRNPNGVFNNLGSAMKHYFDYAPGDFVNLNAGNEVQLGASATALPRVDSPAVPMIYPGIMNIVAGAGGVAFKGDNTFKQLILFPSPLGGLDITTTDGGSITTQLPTSGAAKTPQLFSLIISDSAKTQFRSATDFGVNDHASTPLHLGSEQPVELNISGDVNYFSLTSPEAAEINVVGNLNNSRLQALNLDNSDVTSITVGQAAKDKLEQKGVLNAATDGGLTVGGNINNRSAFTSVDLSQVAGAGVPALDYLGRSQLFSPNPATLVASFYYNPVTKVLTYQNINNVSLATLLTQLQNLTVQVYQNGVPQFADPPYNTIPLTTQVAVIDSATAAALLAQYNALGGVPNDTQGFAVGGPGRFDLTANNLDLGTTPGIVSKGVSYYRAGSTYSLADYFDHGADIHINLTGDLSMYSSSIATLNGGNISIDAAGSVNAGSSDFNVTALGARGIYSTGPGEVSVIAGGDINVNGSRIAAYNGGNLTVESLNGDINAGSGGAGYVQVLSYSVDPVTRAVSYDSPTIPGSGILATTFPGNTGTDVGNILVETPNGSVNANAGGIVQLPLNGENSPNPIVEILAGYELRDLLGNPVDAAHLADGTAVEVSAGRNIDASGSGVIAQNAILKATGDINGVIFSKYSVSLVTPGTISVTALGKTIDAQGGSFGPSLLIGSDKVNANGADPTQILSQDANGGGSTFKQGTAANTASAAASNDTSAPAEKKSDDDGDPSKKKKKEVALAQKVSRVTVLLP